MSRRLVLVAALTACGGADKAPAAPTEPASERPVVGSTDDDAEDGLEVQHEKGHLEPDQIEAGMRPHQAALSACYRDQLPTSRFLGGKIELGFAVAPDGAVTAARVATSDLGSWVVERCMLDVASRMRFAAPRGGAAADFSVPLELDGARGKVLWWADDRGDAELGSHLAELDACSGEHGDPRDLTLTLYVGNRGQVRSIGFASGAAALDPAWADCVAAGAASWKLTDPRGSIAKLSYRYRSE